MAARKPLRAPDKLVFLLAFVPYLLERRVVDVAEAAEHFGLSEREIRDAVRLIATSGLPGETGTYQANDLFDIDWDSFEDDDVIGIVHHVAIDDVTGLYVSSLTGLPAQITGVPRERQRLNDIFDIERQRLADRFTERRKAVLQGRADLDPEAED